MEGRAPLESFTAKKDMVHDPGFWMQKQKAVGALTDGMIDAPIVALVNGFNRLPYCFTLQSCYGHFVYDGQKDPYNVVPLTVGDTAPSTVEYRIAYITLCLEYSRKGKEMLEALAEIPAIDPDNIQLGSAEWFWKRQVNSYVLQVEPTRFKDEDTALLDFEEALKIERTRDTFFARLFELSAL